MQIFRLSDCFILYVLKTCRKMDIFSGVWFFFFLSLGALKFFLGCALEFPLSRQFDIFFTSNWFSLMKRYNEPWTKISKLYVYSRSCLKSVEYWTSERNSPDLRRLFPIFCFTLKLISLLFLTTFCC